jgi:copper chaperone CopZ
MTKALALAFVAALACPAFAGEEEAVQLKIYVDGMTCPTGCAPKVAKGLSAVQGAKDVKLADFDKGLFTLALEAKSELKPDAIQKSIGEYKVKKIEATITGVISLKDKALILTTAAGTKYGLNLTDCCSEEVAKKDAPKEAPKAVEKKDDCETCPVALKAKVEGFAKDGKTVKVSGQVGSCCEVSLTISAIAEVKKATN